MADLSGEAPVPACLPNDTTNAASPEAAQRRRRLDALEKLAAMGARGDFDELLDKKTYRR